MRTLRGMLLILGSLAALIFMLWLWNRAAVVRENSAPDHYNLGKVHVGSTVEFSARFLVSSRKHPFDALFERMVNWFPQSWSPVFAKLHPRNFRAPPGIIDVTSLKPVIEKPPFIRIVKIIPEQRTNWYQARPYVVLHMSIDTSRPGDRSGIVTVTLDHRRASFPVAVAVQEEPKTLPKLLVATTPYESYSTEQGSNFYAASRLLSSLPLNTDYRHELPLSLEPYQVMLLADSALATLNAEGIARVRSWADQGGRVVLACNAFMSGSVPNANQVLTNCGLQVVDKDYGSFVTVTNLAADVLTEGVHRLEFHRPSLIQVTDDSKAKALAVAPGGEGALVAVARLNSGGEIMVLTASLWWYWLGQFETNSDNSVLLANILSGSKRAK